MSGPSVPSGELLKRRNVVPFALVLVVTLVTAGISACKQPESENTQIREVWVKAPNGNKLYSHIHEPANASVENQYPGLALVPGGSGPGTVFDNGQADDIAHKGFVVIHFDPEGRGRSEGQENYNGYVHQDDLYAVILYLKSLPQVDGNNIGVFTRSYGITMGAGALARYPELGVKYLIDWEGPSNRTQHYQDWNGDGIAPDSHNPRVRDGTIKISDDWFWNEREASRFMAEITADYFRIQGEIDHAQGVHKGHAIELLNLATRGKSRWTRCNDNPPNIIYDPLNVTQYKWLPGEADERHKEKILSWIMELSRR
jgi:hypothetical protein